MKKINVKGAIIPNNDKWIYDMLDMDSTCPKDITDILNDAEGKDIELTINSGGGDVYSASEIYTELRNYDGKVTSRIVGIAASAASVIAMAGKVIMSPTASFMIHKASTIAMGNSNDFSHTSEFLDTVDKSICTAYEHKTKMEQKEVLEMMSKETWLDAKQAKEKGFIDEVMFEEKQAVASSHGMLPKQAIELIRNSQKQDSITVNDIKDVVSEMKEEIVNELKEELKENKSKNQQPKNISRLFL